MPSIRLEELTNFGRLAVKLDREFSELARAGEEMGKVKLESDAGLDEGIRILNRVSGYGETIAGTLQQFAAAMQDAQARAEAATAFVAERAQVIRSRKGRQDEMQEALEKVKAEMQAASATLSSFSDADKRAIAAELERLREPMDKFISAAEAIKAEAAAQNYRRVERQADSIIDSLKSSRRKIEQALPPR